MPLIVLQQGGPGARRTGDHDGAQPGCGRVPLPLDERLGTAESPLRLQCVPVMERATSTPGTVGLARRRARRRAGQQILDRAGDERPGATELGALDQGSGSAGERPDAWYMIITFLPLPCGCCGHRAQVRCAP